MGGGWKTATYSAEPQPCICLYLKFYLLCSVTKHKKCIYIITIELWHQSHWLPGFDNSLKTTAASHSLMVKELSLWPLAREERLSTMLYFYSWFSFYPLPITDRLGYGRENGKSKSHCSHHSVARYHINLINKSSSVHQKWPKSIPSPFLSNAVDRNKIPSKSMLDILDSYNYKK